jgi:hypothetical protein
MKRFLKLLAMPVCLLLTLLMVWSNMFGSVLFRILSMIVGLTSLCTVWAWLIGDKMAPMFAGITVGFFLLMFIGTLIHEGSEALVVKLIGYVKGN